MINALIAKGIRCNKSKNIKSESGDKTALTSEIEVELTGAYRIGSNEDVIESDIKLGNPYQDQITDDRVGGRAKSAERAQSEEKCDKEESYASLTNIDENNSVRTLGLETNLKAPVVFDKTIYFDIKNPKWNNQRSRAAYFLKHGTVPVKREPYQRKNYLGHFGRLSGFGRVDPNFDL